MDLTTRICVGLTPPELANVDAAFDAAMQPAVSGKAILIYGPQGCGKTTNAKALQAHYGLSRVIDDWCQGDDRPQGALLLTHDPEATGAIPFAEAMKGLSDSQEAL